MGNPLPLDLAKETRKADKILKDFVDPVNGLDRIIPLNVLKKAKGFAIFSIFRIGFLLTARAGSGVVVAKCSDGTWSAPSAIGIGGIGGGFSAGAEVTDFIVVLNSSAAVKSFMATGSLQLGGNLSVAVGPLGRSAEASGAVNSSGKVAAMFSYSKSQGLFGGVSLEGTVLVDRSDANSKAYQRSITSKQILSGAVDQPNFASGLISTIERLSFTNQESNSPRGSNDYASSSFSADDGASWDRPSMDSRDRSGGGGRDKDLDRYFSQAELDHRQRKAESRQLASGYPSRPRTSSTSAKPDSPASKDPFAASEDEDTSTHARRDRESATRNIGTYSFSSGGGGSLTNSPTAGRATDYGRTTSNSKYSAPTGGLYDDAYAVDQVTLPKRPSFGHRKNSSSFSLSRLTGAKTAKTPPPFGEASTSAARDRLTEAFARSRSNSGYAQGLQSSSEDDLETAAGVERQSSSMGGFGGSDSFGDNFDSFDGSSSSASKARTSPKFFRSSSSNKIDPYANGGLKKMSPADAVRAASAARAEGRSVVPPDSPLAAARASKNGGAAPSSSSDAFGALWNSARESNEYARDSFDNLDHELQRGGRSDTNGFYDGAGAPFPSKPSRPSGGARHDTFSGAVPSSSGPSSPGNSRKSPKNFFRAGSAGRVPTLRNMNTPPLATQDPTPDYDDDGTTNESRWKGITNRTWSPGNWKNKDKNSPATQTPLSLNRSTLSSWSSRSKGDDGTSYDHDNGNGYADDHLTTPRAGPTSTSKTAQKSIFDDDFAAATISTSTSTSNATSRPTSTSSTTNAAANADADTDVLSALPSLGRVIAQYDYSGQEIDDLTFSRGDVIVVLKKTESTNDWWLGKRVKDGKVGSFPANFVE